MKKTQRKHKIQTGVFMLIKIMEKMLLHVNKEKKRIWRDTKKNLSSQLFFGGRVAYVHNGSLNFLFFCSWLTCQIFLKLRFTTCEVSSIYDTPERDRATLQALSSLRKGEKYANEVHRSRVWLAPGLMDSKTLFKYLHYRPIHWLGQKTKRSSSASS